MAIYVEFNVKHTRFENNCPIFCSFAPNILADWLIHDATHGDGYHAGIGSIGGSIFAGNINIHGGDIEATGGKYGAGIGGGDNTGFDNDKTRGGLTVYDGTVTATGGEYGAGIGGGNEGNGAKFTMFGGKVTVTADDNNEHAAGIGGGDEGNSSAVKIFGGTVNATGSSFSAGIGCGLSGTTTDICIYAGTVNATGGKNGGAGIGGCKTLTWAAA